jgi:hypothetical protein
MENIKNYVTKILKERTSLDGITLIAVCGTVIVFGGIAKLLAWAGLAYGVFTLLKREG